MTNLVFYKECQRLADLRVARQVDRQSQFVRLRANYTTTDESKRITNMTLEELLGQLQTRQLTAVDALAAFMTRALDATEDYNCVAMFVPNARVLLTKIISVANSLRNNTTTNVHLIHHYLHPRKWPKN